MQLQDFNVLDTQPAESMMLKSDSEDLMFIWLVGVTIFLGLMLILVISICLSQRARYQRQIKAATVSAFGNNLQLLLFYIIQSFSVYFN